MLKLQYLKTHFKNILTTNPGRNGPGQNDQGHNGPHFDGPGQNGPVGEYT